MPHIPQLALAASIVASVTGALVMCALVFRYGFTVPASAESDDGPTPTDVLVTRVGHAVAGACFAATGVLAIVGLTARAPERAAATVSAVPVAPVAMATRVEPPPAAPPSASAEEVRALEARLAATEAKLSKVEAAMRARSSARSPHTAVAPPPPPPPRAEQTVLRHFDDVRSRLSVRD